MDSFKIIYKDWKADEQKLREALCTLGNGYFATRGAVEENDSNEFNYPGTYLAGGFNRATTKVADRDVVNEDFVNFPNWLCLSFRPEGGEWLNLELYKIHHFEQVLNMKSGTLERDLRVEDKEGRITHLKSRRFVSMRDMHLAGIEWFICPENWNGKLEIRTALDGTVINAGVDRYSDLESRHLRPLATEQFADDSILLLVETRQSKIVMAQAARTRIYNGGQAVNLARETVEQEGKIEQTLKLDVDKGEIYEVEKIVSLYTSRDQAVSEPTVDACKALKRANRLKALLNRHYSAWSRLWHRADMGTINGDKAQKLLRLHTFHILQTTSINSIGLDVSIPSRGLHGEAYRGHIFWDEMFIYPFLNMRFPEITRSLLMYRYNRLDEARHAAAEEGYKGAMFPWQSGSDGREETQEVHLNPQSGNWLPDNTHLQRHVNAAIAYNIWNYYLATNDQQFLSFYGAEMFLSIASFWASKASFNKEKNRYEILHVVGPDEYHTSYPDSEDQGLNNNAYTNIMAAWVLQKAVDLLEIIERSRKRELLRDLEIDEGELRIWTEISHKMFIPFIEEGVINQFEGYEKLKEFPWEEYRSKYDNIQRLDRILESEGDSANNYKVSKQADVLMLFYLFSSEELRGIFERLGYEFNEDLVAETIDYYRKRTSHGSTLSRLVFSWIHSRHDRQKSWENFETLLISDFEDIQGGTTAEGIHLGAMAGSLDLVQRCFAGVTVHEDALWIKPHLPAHLQKINLKIKYQGHWIAISVDHKKIKIAFEEGWSNIVNIGVVENVYKFEKGDVREFAYSPEVNS